MSRETAVKMMHIIDDKLGEDTILMDISKVTAICDYFIITGAKSVRQVKAIADELMYALSLEGINQKHVEGYEEGKWILLDYGDIIVHVFYNEERAFYNLEGMWKDASYIGNII